MLQKRWAHLICLGSILLLATVFIWLRQPAQRLLVLERRDFANATQLRRENAIQQALDISRQDVRPDIQKRVARFILRTLPNGYHIQVQPGQGYDPVLREIVRQTIVQKSPDTQYIRLAGYLKERSVIPRLRELASTISLRNIKLDRNQRAFYFPDTPEWQAYLVLARMGDKQAVRLCIDLIEQAKPRAGEEWLLMRRLDFIRQPETINMLLEYLFEKKGFQEYPHKPAKAEVYRYLYESVEDWPACEPYVPLPALKPIDIVAERQLRRPTPQEIAARKRRIDGCIEDARAWVKSQKTITIKG